MKTIIEYLHVASLAVVLLSVLIVILWYLIYFWYSSYFKKLSVIAPTRPVLGIALTAVNSTDLYTTLLQHFANSKSQTSFSMVGPQPLIVTIDPKFIEMLCNSKRVVKSKWVYPLGKNFLGRGLALADGEEWRTQRKLLTPAFHYNVLQRNLAVFKDHGDRLVETLANDLSDQEPVDIAKYTFKYGLGIIFENTLGISYDCIKKEMSSYIDGVKEIMHILYRRLVNPLHFFDLTYRLSKNYQREKDIINYIHNLVDKAIDLNKELFDTSKNTNDNNNDKFSFLDLLLKNSHYDENLLREEVNTIIYAGTDTNATTLSFIIYTLAKHPEIQEKVFQEMKEIQESLNGGDIGLSDLGRMQYSHMVILENLRLSGTVPFIVKEFKETTTFDGITYPKGVPIVIALFALHRSPRYFKDPDQFIPERHLPENAKAMEPYSFVPFSGGPRNCIGQRYSLLSQKILLYKLLLKYEVLPAKDHQLKLASEIIMVSKTGFKVNFKPRQ